MLFGKNKIKLRLHCHLFDALNGAFECLVEFTDAMPAERKYKTVLRNLLTKYKRRTDGAKHCRKVNNRQGNENRYW